jgi:RHS repeat-associated protein
VWHSRARRSSTREGATARRLILTDRPPCGARVRDPRDDTYTSKDHTYTYDPIGNRAEAEAGSDEHAYNANVLNQYTHANLSSAAADNVASYAYDDDGNLTSAWAAADMNCDGYVTSADIDPFVIALAQGQAAYETAYPDCEYLNADINGDGYVTAADSDLFTSMLTGGNAAVAMTYTYNGENRLIAATPTEPQSGNLRVAFVYDYLGRRVLKVVEEYDGASWSETARRKFVWSGWLMLVEIDASGEADAVLRQNTWGLDLAGQAGDPSPSQGEGLGEGFLARAGGIGGLLAVHDTRGTVPTGDDLDGIFTYDANGNVGQVVDLTATTWSSAAITAHYEYTPYGGVTNTISGYAYAEENPWRFSTKQWDPETALGYWGRRYYSATLGRWMNEDPIEERGGANLYAYVVNGPTGWVDAIGEAHAIGIGGMELWAFLNPPPTRDCTGTFCAATCRLHRGMSAQCEDDENGNCNPCICDCTLNSASPYSGFINDCIRQEEEHHVRADITGCRRDDANRCDPFPNLDPGFNECGGDVANLLCLLNKIKSCGRQDRACKRAIWRAAIRENTQCQSYGPGYPAPPGPTYTIPCTQAQRDLCMQVMKWIAGIAVPGATGDGVLIGSK